MKAEIRKRAKSAGPQCFVATAIYGDVNSYEVRVLRSFRDDRLLKSAMGRVVVDVYYRLSPPVADFIRNKKGLRLLIRKLLDRLVKSLSA